ncbi:uncharacterized protein [Temnothorax longispinosus]|uniref:uncharacterized protein isoform X2 n=1 Tax=Temnothorax longispinosus TaxID=300112 RepID=UPI003A997D16
MSQELGITCPEEHEALEEKYRVLQHKLRDRLEKLNLNLGEIAIMHERAEMAEQAREKNRFAMTLLLDEFKQVLQDFDTCSEIDDERRNKLKAIYERMLDIQNDERKASEELINYEISNSKNCVSHVAEDVAERVRVEESNNVEDSLDYFDKKEEEHTLRQAERNNEVQNINKELALQESLVSELIKNATQETAESRKNIIEMEQELKRLHAEKEEHLQAVHAHNVSSNGIATSHKSKLAHKQVSREEDMPSFKQGYHPLIRNHWNYVKFIEDIKLSSGESKEQEDSFFALPDETIRIILKYLDMRSFCRMSKVNKRLNNLTQDPILFRSLNLRNLKKEYSKDSYFCYDKILFYFASKCKDLQQLDLTASCISELDFVNFLQSCGHCLTHLRLSHCNFVDKLSLLKISQICKNLKVLDLSYCPLGRMDQEVSSLENLEFLVNLDVRDSDIRPEPLCKILQKTRRMRELNLNFFLRQGDWLGWDKTPFEALHLDAITIQLKNSCPDLEIIDLSSHMITSRGIHALAECKNLRKLTMMEMNYSNRDGTIHTIDKHSWRRLFSFCQCLEEVNLIDLHTDQSSINECVYEGLTLCKNLRQLYLWDISSFAILEQCPKLQTIYVIRKWPDDDTRDRQAFIAQAKEKYPHVSILEYQKGVYEEDVEWWGW